MVIHPTPTDIKGLHDFLIEIYNEEDFPIKIEPGYHYQGAIDLVIHNAGLDELHGAPRFPHVLQKAAVYLYYLNSLHPFTDGNKRTSLIVTHYFLRWNGYRLDPPADADIFLKRVADAREELRWDDAYEWILKHTTRTVFDALRGIILNWIHGRTEHDERSFFDTLLDIYAFEPLPNFILDHLTGERQYSQIRGGTEATPRGEAIKESSKHSDI